MHEFVRRIVFRKRQYRNVQFFKFFFKFFCVFVILHFSSYLIGLGLDAGVCLRYPSMPQLFSVIFTALETEKVCIAVMNG